MAANYYCLVAGLTEYSLESGHKGFDVVAMRSEIKAAVSERDKRYIRALYRSYDIENLIAMYYGKESFNELGNLSRDQLKAAIAGAGDDADEHDDDSSLKDTMLPPYLQEIIDAYRNSDDPQRDPDDENIDISRPIEKTIWEAFYKQCSQSKCSFICDYFRFDHTLRNVSAAFIARSHGIQVAPQLVGHNETTEALSRSQAGDFGLRNEIEYIDTIVSILENRNILEKEHDLDDIRWKAADRLTTFNYFDIDFLLAYLLKANIIYRWVALDRERGKAMLDRLIAELAGKELLARTENGETK